MAHSGLYLSNMLLQMYGKCRSVEDSRLIFDGLPYRNSFSWTLMMTAYGQNGHAREARQVFNDMPEKNLVAWTAMVTAYAENRRVDEAKLVFDAMPARNQVSWNGMLSAYAQNGHADEARDVFEAMPERNLVGSTTMVVVLGSSGRVDEARVVFDGMEETDVVAWTALLDAYAQNGHLSAAKAVLEAMPERNEVSWTAMFGVLAESESLESLMELFVQMPEHNVRLLERCPERQHGSVWNAMLAAKAHNSREVEETVGVLREMEAEGVAANETSLVSVMAACSQAGDVGGAWSWMVAMVEDRRLRPHKQHFSCVVDALGRAGRVGEAEDLMAAMPFVPDDVDWRCLVGACKRHLDAGRAARHAAKLERVNSAAPYVLVSTAMKWQSMPVK
ncbi:hypothetical protein SELMODRAFT_444869 [Selaginella moellendorffii]|uniref:PROP1-like PPR domain-containing protein n=1 Tax=Selaginella moellendorffii TaxID=88036 RepID=D8SDK8_SELML|nr:hypothetical protein SELMODRAFT_444869 [Selaginella moellendorffii]